MLLKRALRHCCTAISGRVEADSVRGWKKLIRLRPKVAGAADGLTQQRAGPGYDGISRPGESGSSAPLAPTQSPQDLSDP